jgi:outer membrane receptor protein involved in Fe transport
MPARFFSIALFYLILSFNHGIAQSVLEGLVTDQGKGPLPYATVSLTEMDSSSSKVAQADSAGHFIFKAIPDKNYRLSAYSLGFTKRSLSLSIRKDTAVYLSLEPLQGSLQEVTVISSRPVIERKADRVIFNVANSINAAGSNGLEALSKAPGIKINDNTISLAGKGTLSIMVNGRLLHLSDKALVSYLKSFSSAQISKIEIITHPSAAYDAEGNAGLINIITKRSSKAGFSGEADASVNRFFYKDQPNYKGIRNYGLMNTGLSLNYNKDKWSVYSNISDIPGRELLGYGIDVYYPDKHWAMKDTGEYRVVTFNALAGIDYQVSNKTTLGFEYNYIYHLEDGADYVRVPVYNNKAQLDSTLKTYATYYPVAKSNAFNLHLIQKLGQSGSKLILNADYFNFYRHDKSDLITRSYTDEDKLKEGSTKKLYDTTLQNIRIYTFKADLDLPTPFAQFSFGSKISFINNYSNIYYYNNTGNQLILDSALSNEFRYIENTQALYANASKNTGKWKLDAGLRAEITQTKALSYFQDQKVNKHYLKLFPSALVSYTLNTDNEFSFNYNKRIHRPTFWNLNPYKTFMTAYTYVEGNPYLEPEYITNVELSHHYKGALTSSLYMNVINNGFAQVITTHENSHYTHITTMLNFIRSYRYGISESLTVQPSPWMESTNQVNAYYTYVYSDLPYINGIKGAGLFVETNNTFYFNRNKTFMGSLGFWCQFPEIDHFGRSDTYYSLDIGLQALAFQKRLSLSLTAGDLLQSSASKVYTTVNNIRNAYTNFQLNSSIRLSATWNFGHNEHKRVPVNTGNEAERDRVN